MITHPHNREIFERLYKEYAPGLLFYARKFVDCQTAEDVVHDVFLKAGMSKSFLLTNENRGSYLFRAVRNACLDLLKHQVVHDDYMSRAIRDLKIEELTTGENALDSLIYREQIDAVYKEIDRLPDKCREVFTLAYLEEKKHIDIAEQLNISVRTVEAHIFKALKILRNVLKEKHL